MMGVETSTCDASLQSPSLTARECREWHLLMSMDRHQKDLQAMREAQNNDFERAFDEVRFILPRSTRLEIFVQAALAVSLLYLELPD
jgi:hypothetical protein